jgi:hypothetical protein
VHHERRVSESLLLYHHTACHFPVQHVKNIDDGEAKCCQPTSAKKRRLAWAPARE